MKAWVLYGAGDLRYEEMEVPVLEAGEVLVKVKAAGICASDIPRVYDTGAHRHPIVPGHEFSGVVEAVGRDVGAAWLGKRVGVYPLIFCEGCIPCTQGQHELCRNYDYLGSRRDGGWAEYVRVPMKNLMELPKGVGFEEAAMLEPVAVAVHAVRRGTDDFTLPKSAVLAVCGLGAIGMLVVMLLRDAGYRNIYVVGNKERQRMRAVSAGICADCWCDGGKTDAAAWLRRQAEGVDCFWECTGRNQALSWGADSLNPGGKIVLVGNPWSDMALEKDIYWKLLRNQLTVLGTWNSSFMGSETDDWHYAMSRMEAGRVEPAQLITHSLEFEKLGDGLEMMRKKREDYCKVMVLSK